MYKSFLFLDIDGTVRKGYEELGKFVNGPEDVEVFPEAEAQIRRWTEKGYLPVGVSNQGGVVLGHLTNQQMAESMVETQRQLNNVMYEILACRHHPDAKDPLLRHCLCRKPGVGLLQRAIELSYEDRLPVLFKKSVMVGDRPEDRECAENAGIKFIPAKRWLRGNFEIPEIKP